MEIGFVKGFDGNKIEIVLKKKVRKFDIVMFNDYEGNKCIGIVKRLKKEKDLIAVCDVVGYRDGRGIVRIPSFIDSGTIVRIADREIIRNVMGIENKGLYIGYIINTRTKFFIPTKVLNKHMSILAKTGAGKSYLASIILEELAEKKYTCIVIDPHGEYASLRYKNEEKDMFEYFNINAKSYTNVNIFNTRNAVLDPSFFPSQIVEMLYDKLTISQRNSLFKLPNKRIHIKEYLREYPDILRNVEYMIRRIANMQFFCRKFYNYQNIVKNGYINIFDISAMNYEEQQIFVFKLLNDLFFLRKVMKIPSFFLLIEEAHNFCPERGYGYSIASKVIRSIASEGRKFNIGLCVVSQRAAKISKDVLSQCNTNLIMKITNKNDLDVITDSIEHIDDDIKKEIKSLPIGNVVVGGIAETPLIIEVRVRKTMYKSIEKQEEINTLYLKRMFNKRYIEKKIGSTKYLRETFIDFILVEHDEGNTLFDKNLNFVCIENSIKKGINIEYLKNDMFPVISVLIKNGSVSRNKLISEFGNSLIENMENMGIIDTDGYVCFINRKSRMFCNIEFNGEKKIYKVHTDLLNKIRFFFNSIGINVKRISLIRYPVIVVRKGKKDYVFDSVKGIFL